MNLQLQDKFGNPLRLSEPSDIIVEVPYMGSRTLKKSLLKNQIRIIDAQKGQVFVDFSDFDIGGLNEGEAQNFGAEVIQGGTKFVLHFERALHVVMIEGKKSIKE